MKRPDPRSPEMQRTAADLAMRARLIIVVLGLIVLGLIAAVVNWLA